MATKARRTQSRKRPDASHSGPLSTRVERKTIAELSLLEVNARFMRHEMFAQLVENIRADGGLTSLPFAVLEPDGSYLVLSGNHRVLAAKEAGFEEIDVLVTDDPIDEQRRLAIQLSHNAIAGEDDPSVLAQLYEQLEADWRVYSGLDDRELELLDHVFVPGFREAELDYMSVMINFLPEEKERAEGALETIRKEIPADERWAARRADYERYQTLMATVCDSYHVRNLAIAFGLLCDLAERHLPDLAEGWTTSEGEAQNGDWWVPLSSILGTDRIPAGAAAVIRKAVEQMVSRGEVSKDGGWRALELWAADYLAGPPA